MGSNPPPGIFSKSKNANKKVIFDCNLQEFSNFVMHFKLV